MPRDVDFIDPHNKKVTFHSDRERETRRRARTPFGFLSSRWFMLGYGVFLMIAVVGILLYQKNPNFNFARLKYLFFKKPVKTFIAYDTNAEHARVTLRVKNVSYETTTLSSPRAVFSFFTNTQIFARRTVFLETNTTFPKESVISFTAELPLTDFEESDTIEISYSLGDFTDVLRHEIF